MKFKPRCSGWTNGKPNKGYNYFEEFHQTHLDIGTTSIYLYCYYHGELQFKVSTTVLGAIICFIYLSVALNF